MPCFPLLFCFVLFVVSGTSLADSGSDFRSAFSSSPLALLSLPSPLPRSHPPLPLSCVSFLVLICPLSSVLGCHQAASGLCARGAKACQGRSAKGQAPLDCRHSFHLPRLLSGVCLLAIALFERRLLSVSFISFPPTLCCFRSFLHPPPLFVFVCCFFRALLTLLLVAFVNCPPSIDSPLWHHVLGQC